MTARHGYGIVGQSAPELRVPVWLEGADSALRIAELPEPVIYLFAFQADCRGCHLQGFPAMRAVQQALHDRGTNDKVKFVAVQTGFETHGVDSAETARELVAQYHLTGVALGNDSGYPSTLMRDYQAGGTPWTVIIGPRPGRIVLANGFRLESANVVTLIEEVLSK